VRAGTLVTALSVASTVLGIRLGLTFVGLDRLRRDLLPAAAPFGSDAGTARRIGRAVDKVSRFIPFASCLTQAQACQVLLARRGIASTLCLGVRHGRGSSLVAHAWLVSSGEVVTGARGADPNSFRLLAQLDAQQSWQQ
jgi:hypothetical protein